jgi:hypothetical protein
MSQEAWAVMDGNGVIDVATVCDNRRGAIVNWLLRENGQMALATTTDQEIEKMWIDLRGKSTTRRVVVTLHGG